jgi:glyoxylase-like metal-dependent hydrolase (beta-lactamase superfamily II)
VKIRAFFDDRTSTLSYVAFDGVEKTGVVIDPVLDLDLSSGRTRTDSVDEISRFLDHEQIRVPYVLDTHAHADHLSAMPCFKQRFGSKSVIGSDIVIIQRVVRDLFQLGDALPTDGRQFDVLLKHGEKLDLGEFEVEAIHTPGHTPACVSYRIDDALFVGDVLFQPDYGTARCDFPGGSAAELYASVQHLYRTLPDDTRIFTCHDYQPGGRRLRFESTLSEQKRENVQLRATTTREEFVTFREERDASLSVPELLIPSIQVNVQAGELPAPEENGLSYLRFPLNVFGAATES